MTTAAEAWGLVHEQRLPAKQAAKRLGIQTSRLYEMLGEERAERDSARHRAVAILSALTPRNPIMNADEENVKARATRLLNEGLSTKVICERVGRTDRWLASVRLLRAKETA
jgi:hypothetical protein